MNRKQIRRLIFIIVLILFSFTFFSAGAEGVELRSLLTGEINTALSVGLSAPSYENLAQFGEERLNSLNALLKYLSITLTLDGQTTETTVAIAEQAVFSLTEIDSEQGTYLYCSTNPDTRYEYRETDGEDTFTSFLENEFFRINRLMDDLYVLFEKAGEAFSDNAKKESANLNYSGYGKGVRRATIQFSAETVSEQFPGVLSALAVTEESGRLIDQLSFSGAQKLILLYNQDNHVLRINYDGTVGLAPDALRRVSLVWRCVRTADHTKDNLTLKTPLVGGSDRYNLSYERDLDETDAEHPALSLNLQIDDKNGDERRKVQYLSELNEADGTITGKTQYIVKKDGVETRMTIIPEIRKENDSEYSGTLEINHKKGKIDVSSMLCGLRISPSDKTPASHAEEFQGQMDVAPADTLFERLEVLLIRSLAALPASDLAFLISDIPAETWTLLTESLK